MTQRAGMKLIFKLGEDTMSTYDYAACTKDARSRDNLLTEILKIVANFNVQGILFYWRYPGSPQVNNMKTRQPHNKCFSFISQFAIILPQFIKTKRNAVFKLLFMFLEFQ